MNETFKQFIETLEPYFQNLMSMTPVKVSTLLREMPKEGIYLFSERDRHLYVGRTGNMRNRLQIHCRPSSRHNSASFAFLLAQTLTNN